MYLFHRLAGKVVFQKLFKFNVCNQLFQFCSICLEFVDVYAQNCENYKFTFLLDSPCCGDIVIEEMAMFS